MGVDQPKIIYGSAWKEDKTKDLVVTAVLFGFRAVDTANRPQSYKEGEVGEALVKLQESHGIKRSDLYVQTKFTPAFGYDISKPMPYDPSDPIIKQVESSCQTSLKNLHTTYLDGYIIHGPYDTVNENIEAWRGLCNLQDEGKVRKIGVSNIHELDLLEALHKIRSIQAVQNRWYEGNDWDKPVVKFCKKNGIMYQSFWTLANSPKTLAHPALLEISKAARCTPVQALFKLAQMEGITPISGTTSETHMHEDLDLESIRIKADSESVKIMKKILF